MIAMFLCPHWVHVPTEETQTNKLFNSAKYLYSSLTLTNTVEATRRNLAILFAGQKAF